MSIFFARSIALVFVCFVIFLIILGIYWIFCKFSKKEFKCKKVIKYFVIILIIDLSIQLLAMCLGNAAGKRDYYNNTYSNI